MGFRIRLRVKASVLELLSSTKLCIIHSFSSRHVMGVLKMKIMVMMTGLCVISIAMERDSIATNDMTKMEHI